MKNKKTVAFIEPAGSEANVFEKFMRLPLMGTLYLGTILHNEGYNVSIYNENILPSQIDPFDIKADVYCISALTVSANRARILAYELKRIHSDALVIIGGIHASLSPESFEGVADYIVIGEAESIIVDLIEKRLDTPVVYGEPVKNLDDLPLVNYGLLKGLSTMNIIPMMTSRGCPFDCSFCTVTKVFGRKFRMQSPQRVMREIKHALKFFRTRTIFFYDDNFTANRERVSKLTDLMIQENIGIDWVTQVRSDIAKSPELLKKMKRAGCKFFFIGFESINDETLKAMRKSQSRKDIERAIQVIRRCQINIHGMFMFGDDNDTPETIQATVDFATSYHIDTVQFMIITPFPGTQYYDDIVNQNRLIHQRWDYYNAMFAVFRPSKMSPLRLQTETVKAYERFYSLRRLSGEALRLVTDITVDALTWNFSRTYSYNFDTIFLKAGARFLVGRYVKTFHDYLGFLKKIKENRVISEKY